MIAIICFIHCCKPLLNVDWMTCVVTIDTCKSKSSNWKPTNGTIQRRLKAVDALLIGVSRLFTAAAHSA